MGKQWTFASPPLSGTGKVTLHERSLGEMDGLIPWERPLKVIAPHYRKAERGQPALMLEDTTARPLLAAMFNLSDPRARDTIRESESTRRTAWEVSISRNPGQLRAPEIKWARKSKKLADRTTRRHR